MSHLNLLGIDVSEASIKVLQLDADKSAIAYESVDLPDGTVKQGRILNVEAFSGALNRVLSKFTQGLQSGTDEIFRAVLCVPESKIYSHYCTVPSNMKEYEVETFVCSDAQKIIPFEIEDLYWNYHITDEGGTKNATFIGVTKSDLDNYVKAFTYAKVQPTFVVGELFALGRALLPDPPLMDDYMILDIGAYTSTIGVFSVDAIPNLSIVIQQGGEYLTKYLSEWLDISMEEADQKKKQYGVDPKYDETSVPGILREGLAPIINNLSEVKSHFEQMTGRSVKHVIIAGGSALLPQLCPFITERVGVETTVADPLHKIKGHEFAYGDTPQIFFSNVVGLALTKDHTDFSHLNLLTNYRYDEVDARLASPSGQSIHSGAGLVDFFITILKKLWTKITPHAISNKVARFDWKIILTSLAMLIAVSVLVFVVLNYT